VAGDIGRGLDAVVGGREVTGVTLMQSGPFLTPSFSNGGPVGNGSDPAGLDGNSARPDS
jgi:hypothetical protein